MRPLSRSITYSLSLLARKPGGKTDEEMLARASANVESIRDLSLAAFDAALLELEAAASAPELHGIYMGSLKVAELAATVGFEPVGRAAYSLCTLLEGARDDDRWVRQGLILHIDTMKLLRRNEMPDREVATLLQGLKKVVDRARDDRAV